MSDLISRKAAIDALWDIQRGLQMIDASEGADITIHGVQLALHKIEQLPSAEPKHGKWIRITDSLLSCSECGTYALSKNPNRYCRGCGAKMRMDG